MNINTPVNLIPWCYEWRRDKKIQDRPEAYFIPRRLDRIDKVYRTAYDELGPDLVKSIHYKQDDMLERLLPPPKHPLLVGYLWVGGVTDYKVILKWQDNIPDLKDIEVRTYPTAWGWFGWTVDRVLECTNISTANNIMTFSPDPNWEMDFAYSQRVKSATQMICVFAKEGITVPEVEIVGDSLGVWKEFEFTVEWNFNETKSEFNGEFETHVALAEMTHIDKKNNKATFKCQYSEVSKYGNDSKFTAILDKSKGVGATVLLRELTKGPVCVPEVGLYFAPADCELSAVDYIEKCKSDGLKTVVDKVCEVEEPQHWDEYFKNTRLWRCPDGTEINEFVADYEPPVKFSVPDKQWEAMYSLAVKQLTGHNMWGFLSCEVCKVTAAMEKIGLFEQADNIYQYFFDAKGVKSDGDFSDPAGSFEWAKDMRHDMGYNHEGTHCSTGGLLSSMMRRYRITKDEKWLFDHLERFKQAADWIIRQVSEYAIDFEGREKLHVYGLMPPSMLGDYALPACDWHWYYCDNSEACIALFDLADVLESVGDGDAGYYKDQANTFKSNILDAINREALYAPVRRSGDGMYRSFIPRMAYAGGLLHYQSETNIPNFAFGISDLFKGALPLSHNNRIISVNDRRIKGTIIAMEEFALNTTLDSLEKLAHPTADSETKESEAKLLEDFEKLKRTSKAPEKDLWFWNTFSNLPKISYNSNLFLAQDNIPNFLRFLFNHAVVMVGKNGMMWEHAHPDIFVECENPDNGTAGWFVENFRNMIVMEDNDQLFITRGVPRSWLNQGEVIEGKNVHTYFGTVNFRMSSDIDNDNISVVLNLPEEFNNIVKIRFRHPGKMQVKGLSLDKNIYKILSDGETVEIVPNKKEMVFKVEY